MKWVIFIICWALSVWCLRKCIRLWRWQQEYKPLQQERTRIYEKCKAAYEAGDAEAFSVLHAKHQELAELSLEKIEEMKKL